MIEGHSQKQLLPAELLGTKPNCVPLRFLCGSLNAWGDYKEGIKVNRGQKDGVLIF